jgi:hypothetical protein
MAFSDDAFRMVSETIRDAVTHMSSLRAHLKKLYAYGKPNFYIPQSLLDAFALVLVLTFSVAEKSWPKECLARLDNALPVNISPFDRDTSSSSESRPLLDKTQDIFRSIGDGFKAAKLELLVGLMFRPELPLLTRTTTYEVADAEALLMLVIEHVCLSIDGIPSADLVEDCSKALTYLVSRTTEREIHYALRAFVDRNNSAIKAGRHPARQC